MQLLLSTYGALAPVLPPAAVSYRTSCRARSIGVHRMVFPSRALSGMRIRLLCSLVPARARRLARSWSLREMALASRNDKLSGDCAAVTSIMSNCSSPPYFVIAKISSLRFRPDKLLNFARTVSSVGDEPRVCSSLMHLSASMVGVGRAHFSLRRASRRAISSASAGISSFVIYREFAQGMEIVT